MSFDHQILEKSKKTYIFLQFLGFPPYFFRIFPRTSFCIFSYFSAFFCFPNHPRYPLVVYVWACPGQFPQIVHLYLSQECLSLTGMSLIHSFRGQEVRFKFLHAINNRAKKAGHCEGGIPSPFFLASFLLSNISADSCKWSLKHFKSNINLSKSCLNHTEITPK